MGRCMSRMSGGVRMREYKFRAWDSWWDKMHYFDFTKNIEATPDDELKGLWILHKEGSVYAIQDKIKIMQYTGSKDKNGKEIYEDDLVQVLDYASWEGLYKVVWDEESLMYVLVDAYGDKEKMCEFEHYLVRGDIHENPELFD